MYWVFQFTKKALSHWLHWYGFFTSMNHDMHSQFSEKALSHWLHWYGKFSPVWTMRCILSLQKKLCHTGYILIWFFIYKNFVFNSFHKKMDKRLATLATLIRFLLCAALNDTETILFFEIFSCDCRHKMSTNCKW